MNPKAFNGKGTGSSLFLKYSSSQEKMIALLSHELKHAHDAQKGKIDGFSIHLKNDPINRIIQETRASEASKIITSEMNNKLNTNKYSPVDYYEHGDYSQSSMKTYENLIEKLKKDGVDPKNPNPGK